MELLDKQVQTGAVKNYSRLDVYITWKVVQTPQYSARCTWTNIELKLPERDGRVQLKGCSVLLSTDTVQCSLCNVHCKVCTAYCGLCTVHCALYAALCTLCTQVNHKMPNAVSSIEGAVLVTGQHRQGFCWF